MLTRFMGLLAFVVAALAPLGAQGDGPNIVALVVEVQAGSVRVISAREVRGALVEPDLTAVDHLAGREGDLLIEYRLRPKAQDRTLRTGRFLVSLTPIVESVAGKDAVSPKPVEKRVVAIAVPNLADADTIAFFRVVPSSTTPPDKWARIPIGEASVLGGRK